MRDYPSEESIPPVAQERVAFAVWIGFTLGMIAIYGWATTRFQYRWTDLLPILAFSTTFCVPPGLLGLWLRNRRLRRIRERQAFLASLAQLDSASD